MYKEKEIYDKGYRITEDGKFINKKGDILKFSLSINGYPRKSFKIPSFEQKQSVMLHRICAYQKYGDEIYKPNIVVRHQNGVTTDFRPSNILIGTSQDNSLDEKPILRKRRSVNGRKKAQKITRNFSIEEVKEIRKYHNNVRSYKKTMSKYCGWLFNYTD